MKKITPRYYLVVGVKRAERVSEFTAIHSFIFILFFTYMILSTLLISKVVISNFIYLEKYSSIISRQYMMRRYT